LKSELPRKQTELDSIRQKLYGVSEERSLISKDKDVNLQKLRKVMADEDALKSDERASKDLYKRAENEIEYLIGRMQWSTLRKLDNEIKQRQIKGYHGLLVDLIKIPDKFTTAAEVIAGGNLFNVIVDTDDTASIILKIVSSLKLARINVCPINQMYPGDIR